MKKLSFLAVVVLLTALAGSASAEHSTWGLVQTWYSYTTFDSTEAGYADADVATQTGFGLRRARFAWKYSDDMYFGGIQTEGAGGGIIVLDAFVGINFNEQFTMRLGRFPGVGSQAGGQTSSAKLDMIERPIVPMRWAAATGRQHYRAVGAELAMKPNDMFKAMILLHNGSSDLGEDLAPSVNSHLTDSTVVDTQFLPQIDLGIWAEPMEGLQAGATFGLPNEYRITTGNLTAFLYYFHEMGFAKVDFAMLMHNPEWDDDDLDYTSMGYAVTAGYNVRPCLQVVGRFENWDEDTDLDSDDGDYMHRNFALGVNYSLLEGAKFDHRLQATFTRRLDETPDDVELTDPNIFQLCYQLYFH